MEKALPVPVWSDNFHNICKLNIYCTLCSVHTSYYIPFMILISLTPDFISADPALLHQGHDKEAVGGDGPVPPNCLPSHLHHQDRGRLLLHLRLGVHASCLTGRCISGCIRVYRVYICILSFQLVLYMINDFFKKIQYVVLKSHLWLQHLFISEKIF